MTETPSQTTRRVIQAETGFVCAEDGFWVFWPKENRGFFESWHLRALADELDRKNAPWEAQIKADFASKSRGTP